ncbi:hypothetical protein Dsin_007018 [Dipteronia sinensis]|uniref:Uncharacterized protein n=1 Tax=Dipteronia sinensis TaxID=43782 RepID=A0AAE0AZE3_9ROSI|nr:hypothetical protein Dsin_007018 [Dipteronia sinensis]
MNSISLLIANKVYPMPPLFSPIVYRVENYEKCSNEVFLMDLRSQVLFTIRRKIVYRVENYDKKCSNEVFLMDLRGQVISTIRRKKTLVFGRWNVYGWSSCSCNIRKEKPWFQVKTYCRIFRGDKACQITVGQNKYWIERSSGPYKAAFRIVNIYGSIIAEVNQKQSSSGMMFGEDVLTLKVESHIDHSFIVALVIVHGLINRKMFCLDSISICDCLPDTIGWSFDSSGLFTVKSFWHRLEEGFSGAAIVGVQDAITAEVMAVARAIELCAMKQALGAKKLFSKAIRRYQKKPQHLGQVRVVFKFRTSNSVADSLAKNGSGGGQDMLSWSLS